MRGREARPGEETAALLVRDAAEHWGELRAALEAQGVEVCEVRGFRQAAERLKGAEPPQMVFTAVLLADGDWEKVLHLGRRAGAPVIVVSTCREARFCLRFLQKGAFDVIVPPIDAAEVAYVVQNARGRRAAAALRAA